MAILNIFWEILATLSEEMFVMRRIGKCEVGFNVD